MTAGPTLASAPRLERKSIAGCPGIPRPAGQGGGSERDVLVRHLGVARAAALPVVGQVRDGDAVPVDAVAERRNAARQQPQPCEDSKRHCSEPVFLKLLFRSFNHF